MPTRSGDSWNSNRAAGGFTLGPLDSESPGAQPDASSPRAVTPSCTATGAADPRTIPMELSEHFWAETLYGSRLPLALPFGTAEVLGRAREAGQTGRTTVVIHDEARLALQQWMQQGEYPLEIYLAATWAVLLHRYTGESDCVFGVFPSALKSDERLPASESADLSPRPLRVVVTSDSSIRTLVRTLYQQWREIGPHGCVSNSRIAQLLDLPAATHLFETAVVTSPRKLKDDDLTTTSLPLALRIHSSSPWDLELVYDTGRFSAECVSRMGGHLSTLLGGMAVDIDRRVGDLPLLTPEEQHQILVEWNSTSRPFDENKCIHELFESQVAKSPNAVAALNEWATWTYQSLNERANQVAHQLRSLGIGPGQFVGVYMHRRLEMLPALLGILKSGAAYVPIETTIPEARAQSILNSLQIRCVITHSSLQQALSSWQTHVPQLADVLCMDSDTDCVSGCDSQLRSWTSSQLDQQPTTNVPRAGSSRDTAYVIFTSGSTGTPKGVVVAHRPVINLIEWVNGTFAVGPQDRILFITSLSFDLSVYDIFGILAAGGSIRMVAADEIRDPQRLLSILQNEPITFWDSAPQALNQLSPLLGELSANKKEHQQLRLIFLSGDWIPVSLPTLVKKVFPAVEVVSLGGATEATVWSNFYRIGEVSPAWKSIPYGKPIQNAKYFILDPNRQLCPIGVTGELHIGGECLAEGYTDEEKTERQFISHQLGSDTYRLYKTGDLARFQSDGTIELIGRIDHQVKIRGYRIELGEIESVLRQHPLVKDALVTVHDDGADEKRLVAYVVPRDLSISCHHELRTALRMNLPHYMIPAAFVALERLPLNSSGKVDRRALPTPDFRRSDCPSQYVAPRSPLEVQLVKVWERVLGVEPIGVADNFFDLGGHSLLAARMKLEMEKILQRSIPLAAILQSPTVAKLAQALEQSECPAQFQSLAIIQSGAARRPLFCIHVLGRGLKFIRPLVPYLDQALPIYGLSTEFLPERLPEHRVETLADYYVREIRAIQPEGPYTLAGLSFGGLVAVEIARRLKAAGQTVDLLAMLDTSFPITEGKGSWWHRLSVIAGMLRNREWRTLDHKAGMFLLSIRESIERLVNLARCRWLEMRGRKLTDPLVDFIQLEVNTRASQIYRPEPYDGRITYFKAMDVQETRMRHDLHWKQIALGGLELHEVPGDHLSMMEEPFVRELGMRLDECLSRAMAGSPAPNSSETRSAPRR